VVSLVAHNFLKLSYSAMTDEQHHEVMFTVDVWLITDIAFYFRKKSGIQG